VLFSVALLSGEPPFGCRVFAPFSTRFSLNSQKWHCADPFLHPLPFFTTGAVRIQRQIGVTVEPFLVRFDQRDGSINCRCAQEQLVFANVGDLWFVSRFVWRLVLILFFCVILSVFVVESKKACHAMHQHYHRCQESTV
jgi:hypothetical protein